MSTNKTHILDAAGLDEALIELNINDQDIAALMGITDRAVRKWRESYGYVADQRAALLILEWMRNPDSLQRAWHDIGLPDGRAVAGRGRPRKKALPVDG